MQALDDLAVRQMRQALDDARLQDGTAGEALCRLVAACEAVSPYLALLYAQSQEFDPDQENQGWADIDTRVAALFHRGQQAGEFRADLTAAWLTDALYSLVAGAAWSVQAGRSAARDFSHMITELLLRGVVRHQAGT